MDWLFELPTLLIGAIIIAVDFGVVMLVLFVLQKIGIKAIGGFTITAMFQGLKNAFFTFIAIDVVVGGIAIIPIYGFGQSVKEGFMITFAIIWVAIFIWFIFAWLSREQRSGKMLLDLISFPNRTLFLLSGALVLVFGAIGGFSYGRESMGYSRLVSTVIGLSAGVCLILMGLGRIQIRENGILAYVDLIKWGKIESFEWVYDNQKLYTLKLKYRGRLPSILRGGAISVPADKKDRLDTFFKQYLSELVLTQNHF
jgi:hypothetical protein